LALELAAARAGLIGLQELATRLEQTAGELGRGPRDAPARERTLDATIEWSYRLLDSDEQAAFAGFAVFLGGATLDAAQTVISARLGAVEALIAKNLIERQQQTDGSTRLVMLKTVRHYALERLMRDPREPAVARLTSTSTSSLRSARSHGYQLMRNPKRWPRLIASWRISAARCSGRWPGRP
jgi:predicted ATPase